MKKQGHELVLGVLYLADTHLFRLFKKLEFVKFLFDVKERNIHVQVFTVLKTCTFLF